MDYTIFLWIALIILSTKILGILCKNIGLPEVVGFLLAGIIIGPSCLNLIDMNTENGLFLTNASELGVIFLMFEAGLTTEMEEMKKNIVASVVTAVIGVAVPLLGGTLAFICFYHADLSNYNQFLESLFVGVVLTATSVSITVQTLKEMGKLGGPVGTTILGAAVIDDVLGVIVLSIVSGLKDPSVSPSSVLVKIVLYIIIVAILCYAVIMAEPIIKNADHKRRAGLFAIAFALIMAFISEHYFGIADITGAYFAGLALSMSKTAGYIDIKVSDISNMFFSCIFFACIGIKVTLGGMSADAWIFALILTVIAILTKIVGCGLGAKVCGFQWKEAVQIGVGMISRGEVALIVADKGQAYGLVSDELFPPIVLMVIITTLLTPLLLKISFKEKAAVAK